MRPRFSLVFLLFLVGCATSESRVEELGAKTFERAKRRYFVEEGERVNAYVHCVVKALTAALPIQHQWEVVIFKNEEANAFALPGGKIGVNTGLLRAALNSDQLAAVLGHEIGHVIAEHGRERMTQQFSLDAFRVVSTIATRGSDSSAAVADGLAGVAQIGILYPFNQVQESEADLIGLQLAASAGFDPSQAIDFWLNMQTLGVLNSSSSFSSHPAIKERIQKLKVHMSDVVTLRPSKESVKCKG